MLCYIASINIWFALKGNQHLKAASDGIAVRAQGSTFGKNRIGKVIQSACAYQIDHIHGVSVLRVSK